MGTNKVDVEDCPGHLYVAGETLMVDGDRRAGLGWWNRSCTEYRVIVEEVLTLHGQLW